MSPSEYPCPSCGFLVFSEPIGSYEICPLCGWEDDPAQFADPGMCGGANRMSLYESQKTALSIFPPDMRRFGEFERADDWRPLKPSE